MVKRGKTWHYDFILDGVRYRGSTGLEDRKEAEAAVAAKKVALREKHSATLMWEQAKKKIVKAENARATITPDLLFMAYNMNSEHSDARDKIVKSNIDAFCSFVGKGVVVSNYTHSDAQRYYDYVKASRLAGETKNQRIAVIKKAFFNLGKDYAILENPFDGFHPFRKDTVSREAFTPDELRLIGENAKGWVLDLCITALSTGLREGDICTLKQSSVDLAGGWLTVKTRKTGTPVDIPIMPGLKTHLAHAMAVPGEYVFPELNEMYTKHRCAISAGIKKFFDSIGISGATKKECDRKNASSIKDVHSFRHTFVYLAAVNGVPFPIVQSIVGHSSPSMTRHYMDHANRQAKAQYLSQLPNYLTGGDQRDDRELLMDAVRTMPIEKVRQLLALV